MTLFMMLAAWLGLLLASLPVLAAPASPDSGTSPELLQLTTANWTESISSGSWLIEFYSPYCHFCKAFMPMWRELSLNKQSLAADSTAPFRMAQVNCYSQRQLCVDQEVPHFPKLTLYADGKRSDEEYQGLREYTELSRWIDERANSYKQSKGSSNNEGPAPAATSQPEVSPQQQPVPAEPAILQDASGPEFPAQAPKASQDQVNPPLDVPVPPASPPEPVIPAVDVPAPEEPAQPPTPQTPPIDESMPNPRGELLQYGITPGLGTLPELRAWLGVGRSANDSEVTEAARPGKRPQPGLIDLVNANEGNVGTGATDLGGGHGGAHHIPIPGADHGDDGVASSDHDANIRTRLPLRKDTISKGGTIVKFFAPWCPHCKAMAKAFEALAPALKEKLNVLEVDCEANKSVCRAFGVASYPTIRLYSPTNRLVSEYRGSRSFDAMHKWCLKAAEEESVDLAIAPDDDFWTKVITPREEVRFLWLTDGSDLDVGRGVVVTEWEEERDLVTAASRGMFTSPFRVYRSSHAALASRFEGWLGKRGHGGYRSVVLAFKDHKADRPIAAFHVSERESTSSIQALVEWRRRERSRLAEWLDWNRYPTVSQVGGDSWTDVVNNHHGAPVVMALLSEEHHDGQIFPTGTGSARREAEVAALRRMALAWRTSGKKYEGNARNVGPHQSNSTEDGKVRLDSSGGVIWGWIDADRWRRAISSYYSLHQPSHFPALVLVDGPSLQYYPLPTLKPSTVTEASKMDPPPTVVGSSVMGGREKLEGMTYMGVSREISTWLGRGAQAQQSTVEAGAQFNDDLYLLDEIEAIGRGERKHLARTSRSYLDRSVRGVGSIFGLSVRHPFWTVVAVAALVTAYMQYRKARRHGMQRRTDARVDHERGLDAVLIEKRHGHGSSPSPSAHTANGNSGNGSAGKSWWGDGAGSHSAGTKAD